METYVSQTVPEEDLIISRWMLFLAGKIAPRHDRDVVLGDIRALRCNSHREYAWRTGELLGGVITARMAEAFSIWLVTAEVLSLYIAVSLPDGHTPVLPFLVLLAFLIALWRVRDAYAYPAEGSAPEMFIDLLFGVGLVLVLQVFFRSEAPRLALSPAKVVAVAIGTIWESAMRMLARREDFRDPQLQRVKGKVGALWQMTILWCIACNTLQILNAIAVPGSHMRDRLMGYLMGVSMLAMIRLKKANYVSIWQHVLPSLLYPGLPELQKALDTLWFRDKLSRFRSDLCAEASYFMVLGFPIAQGVWRWVSLNPAAAETDSFQLAVNLGAWFGLMGLWIHIKSLHEKLAGEIRVEIQRRKQAGI